MTEPINQIHVISYEDQQTGEITVYVLDGITVAPFLGMFDSLQASLKIVPVEDGETTEEAHATDTDLDATVQAQIRAGDDPFTVPSEGKGCSDPNCCQNE
jgi:hypothetical protein